MNILDENRALIADTAADDDVLHWFDHLSIIRPARLLAWPCVGCRTCMGRKYNRLHNGCPVCGGDMRMSDTLCAKCECIMLGCGGGGHTSGGYYTVRRGYNMSILDSVDYVYTERPPTPPDNEMWDEMGRACVYSRIVLARCNNGRNACHDCIRMHCLSNVCPVCGHIHDVYTVRTFLCQCGAALSTCRPTISLLICGVAVPAIPEREDTI